MRITKKGSVKKCVKYLRRPALAACVLIFQLAGCGAAELEDRCFPMLAAVDYDTEYAFAYGFPELSQKENTDVDASKVDAATTEGVSFPAAVSAFHQQLDKQADCNHLKVLVLGEELFGQRQALFDMFKSLRESELFPRNIYVCVTKNLDELWETEGSLPTDLGSYLETFLLNHEKEHDSKLVTLGMILDETENHSRLLYLPNIMVEEGAVCWETDRELDMRTEG
ncbi:MAG: hypothetical protein NC180_01620 [Muribaculaceae bacterium]|nr:hypothetical protein [Roseburia sp.]MCM1430647.1 hypothetical protein [Muribaculaceae bacterium]MCM1491914.1 hypothetical protein [Muribaculaceae bacterium]